MVAASADSDARAKESEDSDASTNAAVARTLRLRICVIADLPVPSTRAKSRDGEPRSTRSREPGPAESAGGAAAGVELQECRPGRLRHFLVGVGRRRAWSAPARSRADGRARTPRWPVWPRSLLPPDRATPSRNRGPTGRGRHGAPGPGVRDRRRRPSPQVRPPQRVHPPHQGVGTQHGIVGQRRHLVGDAGADMKQGTEGQRAAGLGGPRQRLDQQGRCVVTLRLQPDLDLGAGDVVGHVRSPPEEFVHAGGTEGSDSQHMRDPTEQHLGPTTHATAPRQPAIRTSRAPRAPSTAGAAARPARRGLARPGSRPRCCPAPPRPTPAPRGRRR